MAKGKRGTQTNPITAEDVARAALRTEVMKRVHDKNFDIIKADIKDDYCNYNYELTNGPGNGAVHKVTDSTHVIEESLRQVFKRFNVHLAAISGAFQDSKKEIEDIDKLHEDELTGLFNVTGFELSGSIADPKIKLSGNKYVSDSNGRIEIKTHKIPLDSIGGYKWYNELQSVADDARLEVALYKEGFYVPVKDEEEEDPAQAQMEFETPGANGQEKGTEAF